MATWRPVRKLDAPPGFHWDDEDVLYEKNDSWLSGFAIGMIVGVWIWPIAALVAR